MWNAETKFEITRSQANLVSTTLAEAKSEGHSDARAYAKNALDGCYDLGEIASNPKRLADLIDAIADEDNA